MKKFITLLIVFLFIVTGQGFANDISVQATFSERTNVQDRIWVSTFQLVWNDLIDKVVRDYVYFPEGTPAIAKELNKQSFTTDDISKECYYKTVKKVKKNTKQKIEKAIAKKFSEKSDILDQLDWTPAKNRYIIYAMLKKDFEFLNEFDVLGQGKFGENQIANYFGISKDSDASLRENVEILFYNSKGDFAIKLLTSTNDEVYLYKCSANKPFNYLYSDMIKKMNLYRNVENPVIKLSEYDELKIPNISLSEEKSFDELTDKRIKGTTLYIDKALETVIFNMTNKGVQLKSEAVIGLNKCAMPSQEEPKLFYLDDTFVIFMQEAKKSKPYFALRVFDIAKYQK